MRKHNQCNSLNSSWWERWAWSRLEWESGLKRCMKGNAHQFKQLLGQGHSLDNLQICFCWNCRRKGRVSECSCVQQLTRARELKRVLLPSLCRQAWGGLFVYVQDDRSEWGMGGVLLQPITELQAAGPESSVLKPWSKGIIMNGSTVDRNVNGSWCSGELMMIIDTRRWCRSGPHTGQLRAMESEAVEMSIYSLYRCVIGVTRQHTGFQRTKAKLKIVWNNLLLSRRGSVWNNGPIQEARVFWADPEKREDQPSC